ncbi:GLG2 [Candida pseudojiufengensis]|uniref:GLG2 n=1 Tax=Candida pseudojiufengensis TaxID=497109 RepID=UPI002224115D|nr:GLG2 [Candida pseudojiufengensis]KAI5965182.1 GLG2 [Candida pseudojiufengensis]
MSSAYATLLVGPSYIPGVLTLGSKLRELNTKHKLIILLDSTSIEFEFLKLIEELYDEVIPINDQIIKAPLEKLKNELNREELSITFSKLLLWNLTDYEDIVYLDADILPLQNFDEIFDNFEISTNEIAASPDSGWPDIFNSGLFKIKPNKTTFENLIEFASKGGENTFDGADQGLLNEFFPEWIKIPYLYNVTPNYRNDYQYLPAFKKFFNKIKNLHYIGHLKPWNYENILSSDLSNFHQFWWDDFNKFFGADQNLKYKILNLPRGEASNLKFNKVDDLNKALDQDNLSKDVKNLNLTSEGGGGDTVEDTDDFLVDETIEQRVFPWEYRERKPPSRVFED